MSRLPNFFWTVENSAKIVDFSTLWKKEQGIKVKKFGICWNRENKRGLWKSGKRDVEKSLENGLVFLEKVG